MENAGKVCWFDVLDFLIAFLPVFLSVFNHSHVSLVFVVLPDNLT